MKIKKWGILAMIFCILITSVACAKKPQKPSPKSENEPKPLPKVVEEIEQDALKIMEQVDKLPFLQRVIIEKEMIEQKKKAEEAQMKAAEGGGGGSEEQKQGGEQGGEQGGQQESGQGQAPSSSEEEKPAPMTIEEGILTELMKREKSDEAEKEGQKTPKSLDEVWTSVNATILGLHNKWNVLEPQLIQQGVSPESMNSFENALDNLTKFGFEKKYFETLSVANNLTAYLPDFRAYFKREVPPSIYTLKYQVRNLVLNAAVGDYDVAQESLSKLKDHGQTLKPQLIEKKAKATTDKYDASVNNLEKSLAKKDLQLIKINSSIVLKNILLMEEDLSASM
ncbi:hypothetical protein [Anaerosolibacter sp.]|uniref:hypothetical protein n=1 Tax=Anaerosolibacter sp. TaxID=1872527 RepID=UPI00262F5EC7|nr:hypothetical protein [Anaerosolibacter sp.]